MSKERTQMKIQKNKIFGVRAMRTSTRHGRPQATVDILSHRKKRQGLMDGVKLEWTRINRLQLNRFKKEQSQRMHGRVIKALRTRPPNQIVSLPNKQKFGVLGHHVDPIKTEDKQMYQDLVARRTGLRRIREMETLFRIKILFQIINNCSNFNFYR